MKFFTALTTLGFAATSIANPIVASLETPLEVRQSSIQSLVQGLKSDVLTSTAAINATIAGLSSSSTALQNSTAAASLNAEFAALTTILTTATTATNNLGLIKLPGLGLRSPSTSSLTLIENRQAAPNATEIIADIEEILLEIVSTIKAVLAKFDLSNYFSGLNPLLLALAGLLVGLAAVVDGLLLVVAALLDTVLVGLAAALVALTFA